MIISHKPMRYKIDFFSYAMTAPLMIFIAIIFLYPIFTAVNLSFKDFSLYNRNPVYIGLQNYRVLLNDPDFWLILANTIVWAVLSTAICTIIGLAIAMLLNKKFIGRGVFRALIVSPWAVSFVVVALIWKWIYSPRLSVINDVLIRASIIDQPINFLGNLAGIGPFNLPMMSVIAAAIWRALPFMIIMLLAGLQSISTELYEAAIVDGAGPWKKFSLITLPLLKQVMIVPITLLFVWQIIHFDVVYLMTRGGPNIMTMIMGVSVYQKAFQTYEYSIASTIGVLLLGVGLLPMVYYISEAKKTRI